MLAIKIAPHTPQRAMMSHHDRMPSVKSHYMTPVRSPLSTRTEESSAGRSFNYYDFTIQTFHFCFSIKRFHFRLSTYPLSITNIEKDPELIFLCLSLSLFHCPLLSLSLTISLSISLSFSLFLSLFHSLCLSLSHPLFLFLYLSISLRLSFSLSLYLSYTLYLYLYGFLSFYPSIYLSLSFFLSFSPSISLTRSIYIYIYLSLPLSSLSYLCIVPLRLSLIDLAGSERGADTQCNNRQVCKSSKSFCHTTQSPLFLKENLRYLLFLQPHIL